MNNSFNKKLKSIKSILSMCLLLSFAVQAAKPTLVTKEKFEGEWPFKRPEIYIQCLDNGRIIAIHASSLASYALNENAKEAAKSLSGYKPVEDILLVDDKGKTKELTSMIVFGQTLCK